MERKAQRRGWLGKFAGHILKEPGTTGTSRRWEDKARAAPDTTATTKIELALRGLREHEGRIRAMLRQAPVDSDAASRFLRAARKNVAVILPVVWSGALNASPYLPANMIALATGYWKNVYDLCVQACAGEHDRDRRPDMETTQHSRTLWLMAFEALCEQASWSLLGYHELGPEWRRRRMTLVRLGARFADATANRPDHATPLFTTILLEMAGSYKLSPPDIDRLVIRPDRSQR